MIGVEKDKIMFKEGSKNITKDYDMYDIFQQYKKQFMKL